MKFTELIKDIFNTSATRIKNPIVSSFFVSFILYNWKAVLTVLFSDYDMEGKIEHIEKNYSTLDGFLVPLIISIFYILVLPYLRNIFDSILTSANTKKSKNIKSKIFEDLEFQKEKVRYEREIAEEKAGTSEINSLKDQLNASIDEKEKLNDLLKKSYEDNKKTLNDKEISIENYKTELEHKEYFMPKTIYEVYKNLSSIQINRLIVFYKYFELNLPANVSKEMLAPDLIEDYIDYKLVNLKNGALTFTNFGKAVLESIIKNKG